MLAEHVAALRCPHCKQPLRADQGTLRCPGGHSFDIARQGYVTLVPPSAPGDTSAMIASRVEVQGSGLFAPLAGELERLIAAHAPAAAVVVDVGSGPGYYLASLMSEQRLGLAVDSSKYAARRAARVHPRVAAVVADTARELPIATGCADVVLDVFAPRNGSEFRRILAAGGCLLVAIPEPDHLAALRARVSMLTVESGKWQRLLATLDAHFELVDQVVVRWNQELDRTQLRHLVLMGPAAFHTDHAALDAELAAVPERLEVEAAVTIACFSPRR